MLLFVIIYKAVMLLYIVHKAVMLLYIVHRAVMLLFVIVYIDLFQTRAEWNVCTEL